MHQSSGRLGYPKHPKPRVVLGMLMASVVTVGCRSAASPTPMPPPARAQVSTVEVATVHFAPTLRDVERNRRELVRLTEEAARNGAKIIVHTEMATSGYAYFSREDISRVAETVPGPTTDALGRVARQHGIYVAVGMPVTEPTTGLFYNSAVLLGPDGEVVGVYHKRNNLLEASYNAKEFGPIPTYETPYGRLALVICADLFYSQFPRAAALAGTDILLAPANVGITSEFLRVRTFENDFAVIVANRYGKEEQGAPKHFFNQNSFTIPLPFPYDFDYGSRSVIMTRAGEVRADLSAPEDAIGYAELAVRSGKQRFPAVRRPSLYSLLGQDTLEPYTFTQLRLPAARVFAAAAVDPGPADDPWQAALAAAQAALDAATGAGQDLELVVYPANRFDQPDAQGLARLQAFSTENDVDLMVQFGGMVPPTSQLLTPSDGPYTYQRTHRGRREPIPSDELGDDYWVVDRDYGRVALLHDRDLFAPETSLVMAKMGVDVIAVNADSAAGVLSGLWQSRTAEYLHLVVANRQGEEGIYLGGYRANPSYREAEGMVLMEIDTSHVRPKKETRFFDFHPLLQPCRISRC